MANRTAELKARILSEGLRITRNALKAYGPPFLRKRRAYGNPDPLEYTATAIPQELILGKDPALVVSVDVSPESDIVLDVESPDLFFITTDGEERYEVNFPREPAFYRQRIAVDRYASQVITLYGGASLGIFAFGRCDLVDRGEACKYCSIEPNRTRNTSYPIVVKPADLEEALRLALRDNTHPAEQIMLNGGNFPDPDRSFEYYLSLCKTARRAIEESGREIELHLIVFPPRNLDLLADLRGLDASVAMNLEVFDEKLFQLYCPGKHEVAGQAHIRNALTFAADRLAPSRVFSILVGGLEPIASLRAGMRNIARSGIVPVVNVFHPDPETPLAARPRPSTDEILSMGSALQEIYQDHGFAPFYNRCGRHSLDAEAAMGLFD